MVANMLKRDATPVRTEAAELLLVEAANIDTELTLLHEAASKKNHRIKELEEALGHTLTFLDTYRYVNGMLLSHATASYHAQFVQKLKSLETPN